MAVFEATNAVRENPAWFVGELQEMLVNFDGKKYVVDGKPTLMTNEGAEAVQELIEFLLDKEPLPPLEFSNAMSHAAWDHV
jgi:hypothetical protein